VVGDDAQSIYSFRAAFQRDDVGYGTELVGKVEDVALAAERFAKNLWTERRPADRPELISVRDEVGQARYVVERVLENREGGTILKHQAVLFRSRITGRLEIELTPP
jgi:DNA helicase II / ATP-dependent DNA helicase PcrA